MPLNKWGRFSLRTIGDEPAALSVANKRNGIFARDGEAGQKNARIDLFLDIGEYKLQVQRPKKGTGKTTVKAYPFTYPADLKPPYLIPFRENQLTLSDMQQSAFWFEVHSDTSIYIEAQGRYLEDMRLWRDGEWMVTTENHTFTFHPRPETPLKGITMYARVPKGTYMVGVYGGPGLDWAIDSFSNQLYLQWGIETANANCMSIMTVPPRGYLQMLIGQDVNRVIFEETDRERLIVEAYNVGESFSPENRICRDSIHARSASPRTILNTRIIIG